MTKQRARELKSITAGIYVDVLDIMGSHKRGHIKGGVEETIVLAGEYLGFRGIPVSGL